MGIVTTDDQHYKDIAAAIKKRTFLYPDGIKPKEMACGIEEACFNANLNGYYEGHQKGFDEGFSFGANSGMETERHNFWSAFQQNGKRSDYSYAFRTAGWTDENFNPAYNITATYANEMFRNSDIEDLMSALAAADVTMHINATELYYFAAGSTIKEFPELGFESNNIQYAFQNCSTLEKIAKLNISTAGSSCNCRNAFSNTKNLTYIRFPKDICPESLNLSAAKTLSRESFASENEDGMGYGLIPALDPNFSGKITVSAEAVSAAFPNRAEWTELCNTRHTWTITEV